MAAVSRLYSLGRQGLVANRAFLTAASSRVTVATPVRHKSGGQLYYFAQGATITNHPPWFSLSLAFQANTSR